MSTAQVLIETPPLTLNENEGGFFMSLTYFTEKEIVKNDSPTNEKLAKFQKKILLSVYSKDLLIAK